MYFKNTQKHIEHSLENDVVGPIQQAIDPSTQKPCDQARNDILSGWLSTTLVQMLFSLITYYSFDTFSVILQRGNKLRDAMVASALKGDLEAAQALKDTPLPLPKDNIIPLPRSVSTETAVYILSSSNNHIFFSKFHI